ncbi:cell wall-binding repeat-containing protein [Microbacterium sp.]|uniref:cell wall-binding repeat-containing protein n=1 Tax=Microbacterium sp. TaxID=51671 RepID=UPI002810DB20|nr:cell wall-binding repeat-containing protein [Microbacterium sp.]
MRRSFFRRATGAVTPLILVFGMAVASPAVASSRVASAAPTVERLWGSDRYETAVAVSQQFDPAPAAVFVAGGADYPDALSATSSAAVVGGPVLLTPRDALPAVVAMEIRRLKPERVFVLGGPSVVSESVVSRLKALVPATERLAGVDRYDTSRRLAARFFAESSAVVLATGRGYADGLVAGAAAGRLRAPTLLIDGKLLALDGATSTAIDRLGARQILLAGGHGSISIQIEQQLRTRGYDVRRHGGASRYETAVDLMHASSTGRPARIFLASGENFPDALAAAALAAQSDGALYLTRAGCVPTIPQRVIAEYADLPRIATGGTAVVSAPAMNNVGCGDPVPVNAPWKTSGLDFSSTVDAPYSDHAPVNVHDAAQNLDSTGLRILNMGPNGSRVDHPVAYAQYGISALLEYQSTGDQIWLERAIRHAERLEQIHTERDSAWYFPYLFDWTYTGKTLHAPWWSAMAQGEALSLFVRLYEETGDERWKAGAGHTWLSLKQPRSSSEPWATMTDQGLLVFEEYAGDLPPLRVLNGHLFALFGVYDYWRLTGDPEAIAYLDGAATTVLEVMPKIRVPGGVSYYCWQDDCRQRVWQNPTYHVIHSWQLDTLARLTGDRRFTDWATILRQDWTPTESRTFMASPGATSPAPDEQVVDPPQ